MLNSPTDAGANSTEELVQAKIHAVEQAQSPENLIAAVRALAGSESPAAIPALIAVFGYNNPAASAIALGAVIAWGDRAVADLITQMDEYNYGARAYSMRCLATIASVQSLEVLIKAATADFAPSVRRAAAKGLGNLRWQDLPDSAQADTQQQIFTALTSLCESGDWSIRYAGIAGLQTLGMRNQSLGQTVGDFLEQYQHREQDRSVRARIQLAAVNSEQ
jgi:phycocyanobilin lyase subunit beta